MVLRLLDKQAGRLTLENLGMAVKRHEEEAMTARKALAEAEKAFAPHEAAIAQSLAAQQAAEKAASEKAAASNRPRARMQSVTSAVTRANRWASADEPHARCNLSAPIPHISSSRWTRRIFLLA